MKSIIFCICSLLFCGSATATVWKITDVLHSGESVGNDGGFGYSSLHDADDNTPMTGNTLVAITGATGTYDDVSGIVDFTFELFNGGLLDLDGELNFNPGGYLDSLATLAYSGLSGTTTGGTTVPGAGVFGFLAGDVCCSGSFDPNSFLPIGVGDLHYLTLWGADFGGGIWDGDYENSIVGMDFRVELSTVPVPAAVWLFGTALVGLFGLQRRKATT